MSTDHAAEAAQIATGGLASGSFDQTRDYLTLAQVHATLALVEQQRITNTLTYAGLKLHEAARSGDEEWEVWRWSGNGIDGHLTAEERAALGVDE